MNVLFYSVWNSEIRGGTMLKLIYGHITNVFRVNFSSNIYSLYSKDLIFGSPDFRILIFEYISKKLEIDFQNVSGRKLAVLTRGNRRPVNE